AFPLPSMSEAQVIVQDCWRALDRTDEQQAVRTLLRRMGATIVDEASGEDFCGISLYRSQPPRNPKLAPKHYLEGAEGKFLPHTPEEQAALMADYCSRFGNTKVVCYCHYCLEGLKLGGADAVHIAQIIF
ncbi:MAG: hypothetical protein MJ099_02615, partial [Clostridia bacterium]|nr:hypothetical protein [Clostridia bacterium]